MTAITKRLIICSSVSVAAREGVMGRAARWKGGLCSKTPRYTVRTVQSIDRAPKPQDIMDHDLDRPKSAVGTRRRILDAAQDLALCAGAGNLSLDAVADRAGVSKGGLLYHFPSKARLLEALVADFLGRFDAALSAEERSGAPDAVIRAYLGQFVKERARGAQPAAGLLAALAEDPDLLAPVQQYESSFLARIRANATDPQMATLIFFALHGMRAMDMFNIGVLDEAAEAELMDWIEAHPSV
jgi:AcrR family transcriptional regulator